MVKMARTSTQASNIDHAIERSAPAIIKSSGQMGRRFVAFESGTDAAGSEPAKLSIGLRSPLYPNTHIPQDLSDYVFHCNSKVALMQ